MIISYLDNNVVKWFNDLWLCAAGRALNRQDYISIAIKAAEFIMKHMVDTANGKLLRSCYGNGAHALEQLNPPIHGFIDDYAFIIQVKFKIYIFFS